MRTNGIYLQITTTLHNPTTDHKQNITFNQTTADIVAFSVKRPINELQPHLYVEILNRTFHLLFFNFATFKFFSLVDDIQPHTTPTAVLSDKLNYLSVSLHQTISD